MKGWTSATRLIPLVLLLAVVGCSTWAPVAAAPPDTPADPLPSSVRVTTADGGQVTLKNPLFVNDSIVSAVAPPPGTVIELPRTGVSEADVSLIEVPRVDTFRTLALVGAIAAASITWARVQGSGGGAEPRDPPLPKDPALALISVFRLLLGSF